MPNALDLVLLIFLRNFSVFEKTAGDLKCRIARKSHLLNEGLEESHESGIKERCQDVRERRGAYLLASYEPGSFHFIFASLRIALIDEDGKTMARTSPAALTSTKRTLQLMALATAWALL